jgi:hypothetical protein
VTVLEIRLSGKLERLATGQLSKELAGKVKTDVAELMENLGLGGTVEVGVSASAARRPLRVLVNGASAPYPPDLMWLLCMENPSGLPDADNGSSHSIADDCLAAHCDADKCAPDDVSRLVVSMVRDRPALLVDSAQTASFAERAGGKVVDSSALESMLQSLLDLGVVPDPPQAIVEILAANENRVADSVETFFAQNQGSKVEIGLSAQYRATLTASSSLEGEPVAKSSIDSISSEMFELLDQRLLVEWGLIPPDLEWTTAHDLADGMIVVKVNDRCSAPYRGLDESDRVLLLGKVGDSFLGGPAARRLLNPANAALELAVIDAGTLEQLDGSVASAPAAGFVALVVYRELVINAHRLISTEQTLFLLQDLEQRAPELVNLVLRHFTLAEITQVIRALVRERIPPRLLPVMLERLARLVVRPLDHDARPEFVRRGLGGYISERFAGEDGRTFFELSADLELRLAHAATDALYAERVRDSVWSSLRSSRIPPARAALLVRRAARDMVYELLASELPEIVVIRASELGQQVPEPIARIALEASEVA